MHDALRAANYFMMINKLAALFYLIKWRLLKGLTMNLLRNHVLLPILAFMLMASAAYAKPLSPYLTKLNQPVPGGVVVLPLGQVGDSKPLKVNYQDKDVLLLNDQGQWVAVVGLSLKAKPGPSELSWVDAASQTKHSVPFDIKFKQYHVEHVKLNNKRMVNPLQEDLTRIKQETNLQQKVYQSFSTIDLTSIQMISPTDRPVSGAFGSRRVFNGEERNPHLGTDFKAPAGSPIKAPLAGRVALVGDYFFNGQTVLVDHGQGLISMFAHLSSIKVKEGDQLTQGQVLGLVGSTGRSTGPHLHWTMSLNDTRIDPAIFLPKP
jgi:murein DD-endopeptidase MepM/ murein hydrolase activator NlpD